jgi:hypothetical protein
MAVKAIVSRMTRVFRDDMIDLTSHLDKDQREQRDASDVAHQGVVRHTGITRLQCWSLYCPCESHAGHRCCSKRALGQARMKKSFTVSLQAFARIRGGETVALTVVFYRTNPNGKQQPHFRLQGQDPLSRLSRRQVQAQRRDFNLTCRCPYLDK